MGNLLYNFWIVLLGLFEMFLQYLKAEIGILGDFIGAIGIIRKIIATIIALVGLLCTIHHKQWYIDRRKGHFKNR